jgi:HlyD family secretion protein
MHHKRPAIPLIVLLVLVVVAGGYFGLRPLFTPVVSNLSASGTIEAIEVTISAETSGKVAEITVEEGTPIKAGDLLFRLDDTLLQAQRAVSVTSLDMARAAALTADAALATGQANYNLAVNAARLESASTRTSNWTSELGSSSTRSEEINAALNEMNAALLGRDKAYESLNTLLSDPASSDFVDAEMHLLDVQASVSVAQIVLQRAYLSPNIDLHDAAQLAYDDTKKKQDDAQAIYDNLRGSNPAKAILIARSNLAISQERYEVAQDHLLTLQTGENSPKVAAALAILHQAQAASDQARIGVKQAEASLALIDLQIDKLSVLAPADGIILTRSIQPGEVVIPGAAVMILGRLENLTITVYVPENLYGGLSLGQSAFVSVDSFPGHTFTATISHISDQAEFTPRNVQTAEGRSSTVFAIKLNIQETTGKLKPGMPADVVFGK